jgi:UDP-N-acetylmuramate dehydrogenase
VLGGGSNVVIADAGFPGLVVRVATRGVTADPGAPDADGAVRLTVAAGESWDDVVAHCVAENLAGLECLSGIPGLAGATPIQNVGAYGQEVAGTIVSVRAWDRDRGAIAEIPAADCGFGYRTSRCQHHGRCRPRSATPTWPPSSASRRATGCRCRRPARPC